MKWTTETYWHTEFDTLKNATIIKKNKEYRWCIFERELDFGFGDSYRTKVLAEGHAESLAAAKNKIKEFANK